MIYQHISSKLLTRLEKMERSIIEQFSCRLPLEHALLIGNAQQSYLLQGCRSRYHHLLCQEYPAASSLTEQMCVGNFNNLPYASESLDLIILPHVLECSNNPANILHETAECLSKQGTLFIFSLSPLHYFSTTKTTTHFSTLSTNKIKQLLVKENLEIQTIHSFFSVLSLFSESKIVQKIDELIAPYLSFACSVNFIVAQKVTFSSTLTPLPSFANRKLTLAMENSCSTQRHLEIS